MIVVLEGTNGGGKSAVAKILSERLGAPIWRPFRVSPDSHFNVNPERDAKRLRAAGVPVNTFVDDMYASDALRVLRPPAVILDRSMLSGIAYGMVDNEGWVNDAEQVNWLYQKWESNLTAAGHVLLVHLRVPYEVSVVRCEGRWHPSPATHARLLRVFDDLMDRSRLETMVINTTNRQPDAVARSIMMCEDV